MVVEMSVDRYHIPALHVEHNSPVSTTKPIRYVLMSFFLHGDPHGLHKYSHMCIFQRFIQPQTVLPTLLESISVSRTVLATGLLT